jgi:bacterioferritin-associated ferredoxin
VYVCLCRGVSDRKIRAAIEAGASTVDQIGVQTAAGTVCHDCHPAIEELLRAAREPDRPADLSARRGTGNGNGQNERGSTK